MDIIGFFPKIVDTKYLHDLTDCGTTSSPL